MVPFSPLVKALLAAAGEIIPLTRDAQIALLRKIIRKEQAAADKNRRLKKVGWQLAYAFHTSRAKSLQDEIQRILSHKTPPPPKAPGGLAVSAAVTARARARAAREARAARAAARPPLFPRPGYLPPPLPPRPGYRPPPPPRPGYRQPPPPPVFQPSFGPPPVRPAPLFAPGVYGPAASEEPAVMEPSTLEEKENAGESIEVVDAPWYTRPLGIGAIVFGGVVAFIAVRKKGKKGKGDKADKAA